MDAYKITHYILRCGMMCIRLTNSGSAMSEEDIFSSSSRTAITRTAASALVEAMTMSVSFA